MLHTVLRKHETVNMLQLAAAALLLLLRLAEGGSVWPQPLTVVRFLTAIDKECSVSQSQLKFLPATGNRGEGASS